jgi:hypothetical protein
MRIVVTELSEAAKLALNAHLKWLREYFESRWTGHELDESDRVLCVADMLLIFAGPDAPVRPALRMAAIWLREEFEPRWLKRELRAAERFEILISMTEHFAGRDAPGRRFRHAPRSPSGTIVVADVRDPREHFPSGHH